MLALMNAFGVAGAVAGPIVKPAPSIGSNRGSSSNWLTREYQGMLEEVVKSGFGFRCDYRPGSPAEGFVRDPQGPITDYLMGYIDVTRHQTLSEYTDMIQQVRTRYGVSTSQTWDHMATNRQSLIGI